VVAGHARAGSNLLSAFSSSCGWVVGIFRKCVSHRYQCRPQGCECVPVPSSQHTGHLACSTGFRYRWCHSSSYPSLRDRDFVCGERDYTGFISFENVLYAETLQEGDIYIFPKATLHFQLNVGDGPAVTFNSLTSQNPGFVTAANQLLFTNISAPVLESSLGINAETLKLLQDSSIPLFFGGSKGSS